ncbi:MAG TPA: hypothetical protein VE650_03755 [Acetobacteraceae bacterium]|jgi:hypothetical protein|nr:hypothetical protein [Acetobacteraceae bacterium]
MSPLLHALPLTLLALAGAACQQRTPPTRADVATTAACRNAVDRVYAAQNRADLSRRDERDFAFAGSYNSGIVTRGMGARYQRDQMVSDCVTSTGDQGAQVLDTGEAPTFSPMPR